MGAMKENIRFGEVKSSSREAAEGVVAERGLLPDRCIRSVRLEGSTIEQLEPEFQEIITEDWLRSQAKVSVPLAEGDKYLCLKYFGRTIPVAYGRIVARNQIFSVILEKGGWLSGNKYNKPNLGVDPEGLFGVADSETDAKVAEELSSQGFRCSLSLGRVELDLGMTRRYLANCWQENKEMHDQVYQSFNRIESNNDIPALDFRLGGVTERLGDMSEVFVLGRRNRAAMAVAARMIAEEIELFPQNYRVFLGRPNQISRYRQVFDEVSQRGSIPAIEDYYYFLDYYMAIGKKNAWALGRFVDNRRSAGVYVPSAIEFFLSQTKDIDLAGFTYDFELIKEKNKSEESRSVVEIRREYLIAWRYAMTYWNETFVTGLFDTKELRVLFEEYWPEVKYLRS